MSDPTEASPLYPVRPEWLARYDEDVLDPHVPVVDPHHHLWIRAGEPYLLPEFAHDLASGHDVVATVFVECHSQYFPEGPEHLRPVGETVFAAQVADQAAGEGGGRRICAGIVGHVDLMLGDGAKAVLEAHVEAGRGSFRGIRQIAVWHEDDRVKGTLSKPLPHLLLDPTFREGFAALAPLNLSYDAWALHTQLAELADLARAFPDTTIVMNHAGGAIGVGPYASRHEDAFVEWSAGIRALAALPNVHAKLGGFGMRLWGFDFADRPEPPTSSELAERWKPYVEYCIEAFGPERCMFETNFPVDNGVTTYKILWNAFKRLAAPYSDDERAALLRRAAANVYRLGDVG
jgi:L-fuconolactonase